MRMARWPKTHFWIGFLISFGISFIAMAFGGFSVSTEGGGWQSRNTLIANRQTQLLMITQHQDNLTAGDNTDAVWEELITNVQPGWEEDELNDDRRLVESVPVTKGYRRSSASTYKREMPVSSRHNHLSSLLARRLQEESDDGTLTGCDTGWYTDGRMDNATRLWPVWKVSTKEDTALEPEILEELCLAEQTTQRVLEERGLCFGCEDSPTRKCLPPHGIVLYARVIVTNGMAMSCDELAAAWTPYLDETEAEWKDCIEFIKGNPDASLNEFSEHCHDYFFPSMLDELFDSTGKVEYTSSIFPTTEAMVDDLYEINGDFGKGGDRIEASYDTQDEDFANLLAEGAIGTDMMLATASALITAIAILVHTRSPFLTIVGLVQIIFSFPLAFFAYRFIGQYEFFPFLNFIGVFVVFALGADHVFVAVDKWKNARNDNPNATTEEVAAKALPDAAYAMFLTTSTTAIAFFGTAICPVAPVRLFAIFLGLLILFDYIMDVFLMFPCLCIYDGFRNNSNCCISFCRKIETEEADNVIIADTSSQEADAEAVKPIKTSLIRRILLSYYNGLHKFRWVLLAVSLVCFIVCCVFAATLSLPKSSDVRVLRSSVEYERAYEWRLNLLYSTLEKQEGSQAHVIWGTTPADTGNHNDPESWSTLELDDAFDPSTQAAQQYLKEFCPRFFQEDFADESIADYECPINRFESWLLMQSLMSGTPDEIYLASCDGASALPMDSAAFHGCLSSWALETEEKMVLSRNGVIQVMYFPFSSRVRYDSANKDLDAEWNLIEQWMKDDQKDAPAEVSRGYFSSEDFWWYDTNSAMFQTAYGSAGIALAASAIIILLSSRSLVMTLFSVLSIGYVLASVTAMMVAIGWDLGFLESICFAILIGVSVDFVIHFSHAYVALPGAVSKEKRTKHALIDMGPSVLAAAFTTMAGSVAMLFCVVTFFQKFAIVLFFTIVQATVGSFLIFLTLTDTLGPSQPTYMADRLVGKCRSSTSSSAATAEKNRTSSSNDNDNDRTNHTKSVTRGDEDVVDV